MKKVYVIYIKIPERYYNDCLKFLIPKESIFRYNSGNYSGIYAWTTNKKDLEEFISLRGKDKYKVQKFELDSDEFKEFKRKYIAFRLYRYTYYFDNEYDDDKSSTVLTTRFEYIESTDNMCENMDAYSLRVNPEADYVIFKQKYIDFLDIIGYTSRFDLLSGDDDSGNSRKSYADFQNSFNMTPFGHTNVVDACGVYDQMAVLLYLFKYPFYGEYEDE